MPVVTITRGLLDQTKSIAQAVAERLNARFVSREEVIEHGEKYGLDRFELSKLGLLHRRPPALWDRWGSQRKQFLTIYKAALMDFVVQRGLVYHGNMGQMILADVPTLLRVRLDAPLNHRIRLLADQAGLSIEAARQRLLEFDTRRGAWVKFLFARDYYRHAGNDMILNIRSMSTEAVVEMMAAAVKLPEFAATDESARTINNIHMQSHIEAALAISPRTRGMELGVRCDAETGQVYFTGTEPMVGIKIWRQDITAIAMTVNGVKDVQFDK